MNESINGLATDSSFASLSSVSSSAHPYLHAFRGVGGLGWRVLAALVGGLILRLWMWTAFPQGSGDGVIYGNLAQNIVLHGQFAMSDGSGVLHSSLIRLPGYPLFLAACFRAFGVQNYTAVGYLQIFLELAACLLLADFVCRIRSPRAGLNTLWIAAMCPFIAVYASAPMTESLTFDMICLALWSLERILRSQKPSSWILFTAAISAAATLRPDGALAAFALWPALLFARGATPFAPALRKALLCGVLAVLPFLAWGIRNWQVFHVFEPLAPRYANEPGELPHIGWQHWVKTWCLDFTCTSEVYWNAPDGPVSIDDVPGSAFDSPQQRKATEALMADYNANQELTPAIDDRFEALAEERTKSHPLRTWLWMPLGRLADMTLRPRVENLTIDLRWWEYWNHRSETRFSVVYGLVNFIYLVLGITGLCLKPRFWPYMTAYLLLRCLLLLTIEAPETRYTLEFFPILCAAGGIALQRIFSRRPPVQQRPQ
jgi:hypothetical protein